MSARLELFKPAPEPKTPLGYRRILSPNAGIRVSPLCLGEPACTQLRLPAYLTSMLSRWNVPGSTMGEYVRGYLDTLIDKILTTS